MQVAEQATKTLETFLNKYGMHHDSIDFEECVETFIADMEAGLKGEDSTLMMLPTYLTTEGNVPQNRPIIVIDAGGTNLRVATVTFGEQLKATVEHFRKYPMPGTQGTLTKAEFFGKIADYLAPVVDASDTVGFCFSFPTEILPNRDGRFIRFSKEVSATGMEGAVLGEEINKVLVQRGLSPKKFVLLNDTVAALLGGTTADPSRQADSYIGFILGTGTNTCYIETNANITKAPQAAALPGSMCINMESGNYGKFPRGELDRRFDSGTNNPGSYQLEKMVSGAYQGGLVHLTITQAVADGLFSQEFAQRFSTMDTVTMRDIDSFCDAPQGDNALAGVAAGNKQDCQLLLGLLEASYQRAAKLVAVNLGAILKKTGKGLRPDRPVYVLAEGTTFTKSRVFKEKLGAYVDSLLIGRLGVHVRFVQVEDVTLLGTAIAGLLNG